MTEIDEESKYLLKIFFLEKEKEEILFKVNTIYNDYINLIKELKEQNDSILKENKKS